MLTLHDSIHSRYRKKFAVFFCTGVDFFLFLGGCGGTFLKHPVCQHKYREGPLVVYLPNHFRHWHQWGTKFFFRYSGIKEGLPRCFILTSRTIKILCSPPWLQLRAVLYNGPSILVKKPSLSETDNKDFLRPVSALFLSPLMWAQYSFVFFLVVLVWKGMQKKVNNFQDHFHGDKVNNLGGSYLSAQNVTFFRFLICLGGQIRSPDKFSGCRIKKLIFLFTVSVWCLKKMGEQKRNSNTQYPFVIQRGGGKKGAGGGK